MTKETTLTGLQREVDALHRLLSIPYETRILAEDLIAKVAMTPSRIPFLVVSQAQYDAYADYCPQSNQDPRWERFQHLMIDGMVVLYEWPPDNWKDLIK